MGPDRLQNVQAADVSLKAAIHVKVKSAKTVATDVVKAVRYIILEVCSSFSCYLHQHSDVV